MMTKTDIRHNICRIFLRTALTSLAGGVLAACTDDMLYDDPSRLPSGEYVHFSAHIAPGAVQTTRSGETLYEPLTLNSDAEDLPLYLHTYEHVLGDDYRSVESSTRGLQVESAQSLHDVHGSFGVRGMMADGSDEYIPLQDTKLLSTTDYKIWTTKTPLRWPGSSKIAFNAIAPYNAITDHSNLLFDTNSTSFTYSALKGNGTNDAETQQDVMMAVANLNREETADYSYRVPLKFHHSLAAVKFAVRDVLAGKVISVTVRGVNGTGDCVFTATDTGTDGAFEWSNQRDMQSYTQVFNQEIKEGNLNPNDESNDVLLTDKMPEKTFMLIPQEIPQDAEIEVEIERYNVAPGLPSVIKVKGKIRSNDVTEWKAGHEYVYTISTSKDNWVYVFEATGNDAEGKSNIFVYSPSHTGFDTYGNTAYFDVKSYRYKANDQKYIEPLPWTASHDGSLSYNVDGGGEVAYPIANPQQKYVSASVWITDTFSTPLKGQGSETSSALERHNLNFLPHYVSTNWKGDETMQAYAPYSGFTKEKPYNLATFGGKLGETTANCYVIDRGGWYMLPLVYGNAKWKGNTNEKAYKSQSTSGDADLKLLKTMTDYNGTAISGPEITNVPTNAKAELVWQDAYDMVESVELVTIGGKKMIRFHVDPNSIQQGNAVLALKDGSNVMWSWHIWATEHWLDPTSRLPHVFDTGNSRFGTFKANDVTKMREYGDVEVTHNQKDRSFMMAPYNVGWCDPKKVIYLKRKSDMEFVQYMADGKKVTGKTRTLPIIQQGEVIDYKYANNTYYQWGRKDPMRGYFNHEHSMKRTFGPSGTQPKLAYHEDLGETVTIKRSIRRPYEFYVSKSGDRNSKYQDWLTTNFKSNLWNNHKDVGMEAIDDDNDHEDLWCHVKTIYDPSPAGYMVPNAGVWHVVQKKWSDTYTDVNGKDYTKTYYNKNTGTYYGDAAYTIVVSQRDKWAGGNWNWSKFQNKVNGVLIDDYNYKVWAKGNANVDAEALFFSSTGNRWWTDGWTPNDIGAGGNFGRNVSYAWSNRSYHSRKDGKVTTNVNAYGMALGLDTDREIEGENAELRYYVGGQFIGRRAMGRPVRCIQEY